MAGGDAGGLPRELAPTSSRRRVTALLLGTLLLGVAANQVARGALGLYTPNIGYALVAQKWRLLQERERPVDWLVLGDSSCNQGLDPALLARELGGEALNLCTVASSLALDAAWMLELHIERLGPPAGVALIHSYHVWHRDFEAFSLAHVPLPWGFWRELEPRLELDAAQTWRSWLARYVPLYAENKSLMRLLMRPWQARRHYRVDGRGFMEVARGSQRGLERDARRRLAWLESREGLRLSAENRAALARVGALAERHAFDVYLVNAPVYRGIAETAAYRRYQAEVARMLREIASPHARVHFLARQFVFDRGEMQNGDHLFADAAARYSRAVAREIARLQTGSLAGREAPDRSS